MENDSAHEERIPGKRDLERFPEDGLDYNSTGKSSVLYVTFRVKTQAGSKVYDSRQLRDRIKHLPQKAQFQLEARLLPFKRAPDMNVHLRVAKRLSLQERRMQTRANDSSAVRSCQGRVQWCAANKLLGMVLLFPLITIYLACMMPGAQRTLLSQCPFAGLAEES